MNRDESVFDVERLVLHTAMHRPSSVADMPLLPKHFAGEVHAQVWELILSMSLDSKPVDPVYLYDAAMRVGHRSTAEAVMAIAASRDLYAVTDAAPQARRQRCGQCDAAADGPARRRQEL